MSRVGASDIIFTYENDIFTAWTQPGVYPVRMFTLPEEDLLHILSWWVMNEIARLGATLTSILSKTFGSKVKSAHDPSVPKRAGHFLIIKTAIQLAPLTPGQW